MSHDEIRTWADVERALEGFPRQSVAGFAARAARQVLPSIAALESKYGPEAREWLTACEETVARVEAFAHGEAVTRFALDLAAAAARTAAEATSGAARVHGPSQLIEAAELAYAAAAFAADSARAMNDRRAATMAMQAARAAAGGGEVPGKLTAELHQELRPPGSG